MSRKRAKTTPAAERPMAYGYIRVSAKRQAQTGLGLAAQKKQIDDYYRGLLKSQARWGGVFKDAAVSASKHRFAQRPAAQKLLAKLKRGDHVIIAKLDRGFRDTHDAAGQIDSWRQRGIAVHLLDIRVDTSTSVGRLVVDIMAAIAAWESRRIAERISAVMQLQREQGIAPNGAATLGFRLRGRKREIDPAERKIMARVVRLRQGGKLFREITAILAKEKVRTRDGRRWSKQRIWRAYHRELEIRARQWPPKAGADTKLRSRHETPARGKKKVASGE